MMLDEAREKMHAWIKDLEALRPFVDLGNPARGAFNAAWSEALAQASQAVEQYVEAVGNKPAA